MQINDAVYDNDVEHFIKLTPDDVGNYRARVTGMGTVDGKSQEIMCIDLMFDMVEEEDD